MKIMGVTIPGTGPDRSNRKKKTAADWHAKSQLHAARSTSFDPKLKNKERELRMALKGARAVARATKQPEARANAEKLAAAHAAVKAELMTAQELARSLRPRKSSR